jgi:hypothetical protein
MQAVTALYRIFTTAREPFRVLDGLGDMNRHRMRWWTARWNAGALTCCGATPLYTCLRCVSRNKTSLIWAWRASR